MADDGDVGQEISNRLAASRRRHRDGGKRIGDLCNDMGMRDRRSDREDDDSGQHGRLRKMAVHPRTASAFEQRWRPDCGHLLRRPVSGLGHAPLEAFPSRAATVAWIERLRALPLRGQPRNSHRVVDASDAAPRSRFTRRDESRRGGHLLGKFYIPGAQCRRSPANHPVLEATCASRVFIVVCLAVLVAAPLGGRTGRHQARHEGGRRESHRPEVQGRLEAVDRIDPVPAGAGRPAGRRGHREA